MQILPKSRGQWIRFGLVLGVLLGGAAWFRLDRVAGLLLYGKQEGDLLFQSLPRVEGASDLVDAIEGVTQSHWSHCGILLKKNGEWIVAESIGEVRETPLLLWILRGRGRAFEAYRVNDFKPEGLPPLRQAVESLMGISYDYRYAPPAWRKSTARNLSRWLSPRPPA